MLATRVRMCSGNKKKNDMSGSPGSARLIAGNMSAGYFGTVSASELWTGAELASLVGITTGTLITTNDLYLKFALNGKILFRPMQAIRNNVTWDAINNVGCVLGSKKVSKNGFTYSVRLLKGANKNPADFYAADKSAKTSEWNKLILPLHINASTGVWNGNVFVETNLPNWGIGFTDTDFGNINRIWCQESWIHAPARRLHRGYTNDLTRSDISDSTSGRLWCPVLELDYPSQL